MTKLRVGFIGTGKKCPSERMGFLPMAYQHAAGYQALPDQCELAACADINRENAEIFALMAGIPLNRVFTNHHTMLEKVNLDVVSICTWPHLHSSLVIDCATAGVRAIHCEKPMADTWSGAQMMVQECLRYGVQLTINHQRRFGMPFIQARNILRSGAIGDLKRIEVACNDLYDWGTHYVDLCGFYVDDQPAEWVIGQVDYRSEQLIHGIHVENQAIGNWCYRSGVQGMIATGPSCGMISATNRLIGTEGVIEVGVPNEPLVRIRHHTDAKWQVIDTDGDDLHGPNYHERAIADTIIALESGREPELSGRRALRSTEIIFALYESSRRRGRVDLPLTILDHPLVTMVEAGDMQPASVLASVNSI